jgi:hypothetical protein
MNARSVGCLILGLVAGCASPGARTTTAPAGAGSGGLELLEIDRIERSPGVGDVVVRVANAGPEAALLGIDVRADPGMWLAPARQETSVFHLPPEGERTVSLRYAFAHLSPEATLQVRVGTPQEHAGGWVHIPEPFAVRRFDLGNSEAAGAFLERFDTRATPQLTIYALRGMFSSEELDRLAADRGRAVTALGRLLDVPPPPGIRLVFYPDAASKTADTNHVGAGYARGVTLVEVFNDSVRLDPFHEIAHVVSGQLGWAPAWLNEGFAVYASEHLGADALAQIGSPGKPVDQVACESHRAGELLPMAELMRLPDIGPEETRPRVTYAQAASFTGYLAERFGLPALRAAFANLSPAGSAEENAAAFSRAFGVTSVEAGEAWIARLESLCP